MTKAILFVSTSPEVNLTSSILGLYEILQQQDIKTIYHKPILQQNENCTRSDASANLLRAACAHSDGDSMIATDALERALDEHKIDELMEEVVANYHQMTASTQVVLLEGLRESKNTPYALEINKKLATALGADIIFVSSAKEDNITRLDSRLSYVSDHFAREAIIGVIIEDVGAKNALSESDLKNCHSVAGTLALLAAIPENKVIRAARVVDLQRYLEAKVIFSGDMDNRRIHSYNLFSHSGANVANLPKENSCIFTPADSVDAIMAIAVAGVAVNKPACLVLTGAQSASQFALKLAQPLFAKAALPVLQIESESWQVWSLIAEFNRYIPEDDEVRIKEVQNFFAKHIKRDWITTYLNSEREKSISPAAFRYSIVERAIAAQKTIVLPEGDEPRTVEAASICGARGMAECVLLGSRESILQVAQQQGVSLDKNVRIVDPETIRENYVKRLVKLRGHKGVDENLAREQLQDNVMLGTMMLEVGEVDGLVSGAVHTTANTIRPPLQIIRTLEGVSAVSSVFFMCLPDQVLVYGDCAIIPSPSVDDLAQIAIQSNDSAKAFGIDPKVAMISYSTGTSGAGEEVEKVQQATDRVRRLRPDILIDGPLQYDAAAVASVGKKKAPDSKVAGRATVFIFPDLNTGNTTYKAVQRSANAISMGPVLQGMRKPVNDLSRGALVDDIVYTIAITAVQATQVKASSDA